MINEPSTPSAATTKLTPANKSSAIRAAGTTLKRPPRQELSSFSVLA